MNELNCILEKKSPREFIDSLSDWAFNPQEGLVAYNKIAESPPLIRAVNQLTAFDLTVTNSGIGAWYFELWDEHSGIVELFDKIGADMAAKYLNAALLLFPEGVVPSVADDRLKIEESREAEFVALDREFAKASLDAIERFRAFIKEHRAEFENEMAAFRRVV